METRPGTIIRWNSLKKTLLKTINDNQVVLDIGAHDGFILKKLLAKKKFRALALDTSFSDSLKKEHEDVTLLTASGTSIPLEDDSVDVVFCLDVIEHIMEDAAILSEINRVLKEGGVLVLTTPIKGKKLVRNANMGEIVKSWGHVRYGYTTEEIIQLLGENKFRIIKHDCYYNFFTRYLFYYLFIKEKVKFNEKIKFRLLDLTSRLDSHLKFWCIEHTLICEKM